MREHELKTWPEFFQAILDGTKRHEIRVDDRGFAVGDVLVLREWDPHVDDYTNRKLRVLVTYKTGGGNWGLPSNVCVMSIATTAYAARWREQNGGSNG
jgi:hypothetical protein